MANSNIAIVTLSSTFDEWRTKSNDLIEDRNTLRNGEYYKNSGNVTIAEGGLRISRTAGGTTFTNDNDALISGTLTSTALVVTGDATLGANVSVTATNSTIYANNNVSTRNLISNAAIYASNVVANGFVQVYGQKRDAQNNILNINSTLYMTNSGALFQGNTILANDTITANKSSGLGLNVAANTEIYGTLNVAQNVRFTGVTTNVTGNIIHTGATANLSGNLILAGTANVASNVIIEGTANVNSNARFDGVTTTVTGNLLATGATVNVSGNAIVTGTLNVSSNTILAGTLNVASNAHFTGQTTNVTGNLIVTGTTNVTSNAIVTGTLNVASNAHFTGVTTNVTGNLIVTGTANVASNVVIEGTANVNSNARFAGATTTVTGNLLATGATVNVSGNAVITGTLNVTSNSILTGTLNVASNTNLNGVTTNVAGVLNVVGGTNVGGNLDVDGDVNIDGGDITTSTTTMNVFNGTATTVNFAGAATTLEIGAATGTTNINNNLDVDGDVNIDGGDLTVSTSTFNLANTTATTVNFAGAATTLEIGAASGTTNINNNLDVDGDVNIDGGDLTVSTSAFNLANTTATTVNFAGAATALNLGAASGTTDVKNNLNVTGDLDIDGGDITSTATANLLNTSATTINFGRVANNVTIGNTTGSVTVQGDLTVSGGDITSTATANLLNTTTTTLNLGGSATTIEIGAATGLTNINNNLEVDGDLTVDGGDIITATTTANVANTTATTVNFAGAATTLNMGAAAGTTDVKNNLNVTGDLDVDGGDITGPSTFNVANTSTSAVNLGGAAATVRLGSTSGTTVARNDMTVTNDLEVSGGDITGPSTFNVANTSTAAVNLGGAAATVRVGSASGTTVARNDLTVTNDLEVSGGDITGPATFNLANTSTTAVNVGGAATDVRVGSVSGTTTVRNNLTVTNDLTVTGGDIIGPATTNLANTSGTEVNVGGAAATVRLGSTSGTTTVRNDLSVSGNETVTGTLGVTGNTTLSSNATVSRNLAVSQNATITGSLTAGSINVAASGVVNANATGVTVVVANSTINNTTITNAQITFANVTSRMNATSANITSLFVDNLTVTNPIAAPAESAASLYRLRVGQTARADGFFGVYLGSASDGNAFIKFDNTTGNVWRVTANSTEGTYRTLLTTQNVVDSVVSTSTVDAAAPNAVKTTYDLAASKVSKSGDTMTGALIMSGAGATINAATVNVTSTLGGGSILTIQPNVVIQQDVVITGNLRVEGDSTKFNVATLSVEDNEIILNSNQTGVPSLNASIIAERGSSTDTFVRWAENVDKWGWSDDGSVFYSFDSALNAYAQANTAGNTTSVSANTGSTQRNVGLNFNNSANVAVAVAAGTSGNANVTFDLRSTGVSPGTYNFSTITVDAFGRITSASSGTQGAQGAVGPQGLAGAQGPTGFQGAQGVAGLAGAQGPSGAPGAQGVAGATGAQGVAGATGAQGPSGAPGAQGAAGLAGAQGPSGAPGAQGVAGPQGAQGTAGLAGAQGVAGAPGAQGAAGLAGAQGPSGAPGAQGTAGLAGAQGVAGATGAQGLAGATGAQGPAGFQGAQGVAGATGAQGLTGATGAQGLTGTQGAQGRQGAQGVAGLAGAQGPSGAPGAQGATGAQGLTGLAGAQGPTGPQGAQGTSGVANTTTGHLVVKGLGVGTQAITNDEIHAVGDIIAYYSDMRLKKYLGQIEDALLKLNSIQGFYYTGNEEAGRLGYSTEKREVGVSAQDVEKVLPEIIKPAPVDSQYMTLDYARIVPLLIEAVKELNKKVDNLRETLRKV